MFIYVFIITVCILCIVKIVGEKNDKERVYQNCRGKSLHDQSQLEMFSSNMFIKPNKDNLRGGGEGTVVDPFVSQSIF